MVRKGETINLFFPVIVIIVMIIGFIAMDSIVIVQTGTRGVQTQWGAVTGHIYNEGLSFKMPLIEGVQHMDIKTQKISTQAAAASSDLQIVTSTIALNFRLKADRTAWIKQNIGIDYKAKVIDPAIQEAIKSSTAKFTAEELISKREVVREQMKITLQEKLDEISQFSLVVEAFNIENFDFSEEFNNAIEAKVTAEQNALKAQRDLERIKIEKEQKIAQAQAEAESIRIQSEALNENPDILQLRWIEKWNGTLPHTLVTDGSNGILLTIGT